MDTALLTSLDWTERIRETLRQPAFSPRVSGAGEITLPGFPRSLSIRHYRFLAQTFGQILDADLLLQSYAEELGQVPGGFRDWQAPILADMEAEHGPPPLPPALTPLDRSRRHPTLFYKREDLTITQAYKVRGAVNAMATVMETQGFNRFLAVSTGNHAMGVLKAAEILTPDSVRIVIPETTTPAKKGRLLHRAEQMRQQGHYAQIVVKGDTFDQAREWALAQNEAEYLISPYEDPWVVAGQGTIGMELVRQLGLVAAQAETPPDALVVIAPIGGGGLLAGTATALRMAMAWHPTFRDVHLHLVGLRLENLYSEYGDAIRVKQPGENNRLLFDLLGVQVAQMRDEEMLAGMAFVKSDLDARIEGASGGSLVPILSADVVWEACKPKSTRWVVSILSGGNV